MPLPDSLNVAPASIERALSSLIKRALIEEGVVTNADLAWRQQGDTNVGVRITDAGRGAIGLLNYNAPAPEQTTAATSDAPRKQTKAGMVLQMLRREEGATLEELMSATRWLPHTTRAALTGVRKRGHTIDKGERGEVTCYTITAQ